MTTLVVFKHCFIDCIILLKKPPNHGAFSKSMDHVTLRSVKCFAAETKVFVLSEITRVGIPLLAVKHLKALRKSGYSYQVLVQGGQHM